MAMASDGQLLCCAVQLACSLGWQLMEGSPEPTYVEVVGETRVDAHHANAPALATIGKERG